MTATSALSGSQTLDQRFTCEDGEVHLTGMQSIVRVLIDQRRADARRRLKTAGFVSGYPGSPLGTLDLELARWRSLLDAHDIVQVNGLNEDLAATAVFGTQLIERLPDPRYDGVFGMWFGKAPGVDRTGDAFRHFNYRGIGEHGGVLAVAGDDPNAKSTIIPSDSNSAFADWYMPVLFPGDVQDVIDLGLHGYGLSRASGLGVGFKIVTNVADSSGTALVARDRVDPIVPTVELDGRLFRPKVRMNETGQRMLEVERELFHGRLELARRYAYENGLNRVVDEAPRAWLGLIAAGRAYFDLRQALTDLGLKDQDLARAGVRTMKIGMPFPLEPRAVRSFADGLDEILVIEDKRPFIELFLKEALYGRTGAPRVVGKQDDVGAPLLPAHGELNPDLIARAVARRLAAKVQLPSVEQRIAYLDRPARKPIELLAPRVPYLCSGCPHNRSLVVPDGSIVGAGIGCHIMAIKIDRPEFGELTGFTHMGAEGAQWVGLAPFADLRPVVQNLGDGTFFHSGSLAIRFAVSAGIDLTYKLLYNSAVGMTGGQGVTGAMPIANLARLLEAEGVRRIIITTESPKRYKHKRLSAIAEVWHRDRLVEAQEVLAKTPGVTVLVHDQECAAEKRRKRKRGLVPTPTRKVMINERVCEGCGDCGQKSNCISVQPVDTEFGRKTQIHQSSCNLDYSCLDGDCPSFLTVDVPAGARAAAAPADTLDALPEPPGDVVPADDVTIYMTGIGGTGVVTVSQVLATAATLAGRNVRTLDLTGSSQKAGSVVSQLKVQDGNRPVGASVATGGTDLFLVFDALTAVDPAHLAKADSGRTVAVVSTSQVPTGKMTVDPTLHALDEDVMRSTIDASTRSADNVYLDAQELALRLFADHMVANVLLVGAAYQAGALPIPAKDIEEAFRINGRGAERNILAFRWGRLAHIDPQAVADAGPVPVATPSSRSKRATEAAHGILSTVGASPKLRALIEMRTADLVGYQNRSYASQYVDFVVRVAAAERDTVGEDGPLTAAVATNLHKLMAYKDEYEVARLHLDPDLRAEVTSTFGPGAKVAWNLHPPMLRALGMKRKIRLGRWFTPVFGGLRAMRVVRGHRWDVFGWAHVRRVERALVAHYRATIEQALKCLDQATQEELVELAGLPDLVRGYEQIKIDRVEAYLARVGEVTTALGTYVAPDGVLGELARAADGVAAPIR